ncbi:phage tail protein [Salmonella enterica subsp. enterica serovar Virchow]|uniref:tail fiber protein n=1 Tax=Escherichia TaxID=561 RepID=UPI000BE62121|nr:MULTISPECIES: tail fiber protein [Escherichia]ECM6348092.1 phage tail protein [Salmonella enterica subsp. enterica serovar Virchow]EAC2024752.1 phage tail protein [Escherichia coli]ECN0319891.1 phage tail protein [Salmonella enterica subsp. enterica serovar Virchow]ECN6728741.1 phage tail protein [Salmonella enterica subsp. enterica serovar Virchow]EED0776110.1 phage tail protein [Escherichia coli]
MNDVTVVTSVTYPSSESLALVADVQYHEPYLSAALNRKFRGIVDPGFYAGFLPKPGGGMNLLITSVDGDKTAGAASVDIGEFYQVTIQQRKDISLALSAGKKYAIVLKGRYLLGEDTYQVNTASHIHAAEFVARTYTDSYQLGDGELLVCTVNIPASVSAITQEMIDTSERINRSIGIDISDSVTSTRSDVAASSLAVKKAYDLAKSKYTAQDASTTQKGLVQLSSATNSDSETMAATPKAVKSIKDLADTKAPIESPSLTGTPTAPTAAQGTNSTQIANTAFVKAAITALINGAPGTLDTLKEIAAAINNDPNFSTTINNALALKAPLASPALTGIPTAPTAAQGTNNTQIANTAFVKAAITALINGAPGTLDTLKEIAAAINNDPNYSTTINNALALKAPLASPALTGVPTAPTAAQGTNNTQIATTAYVRAAISALVGSSPEALDTLNELAAALGNDPNFATTMTNALAGKQPLDATLTALAALATGANKLPYFTGKDTVAQTDLTSVGRDILAKTSTLAVIQYLGLRELGTSGEKIPLLSTANTWSARQTFNGGITGALTGNADTATKLKTAININGVRFDGSGDININTLVSRGRVTALEANAQGTSGIQLYEAYNNGYPSPYGNVLHLKGATAAGEGELFIGWSGTSGAHAPVHIRSRRDTDSANWSEWAQVYTSKDSIPGVNAKGDQDTSGNAATATRLQTARTINGVSFDGSKNIELTAENLNLEQTVELAAGSLQKNQNGADIPGKDTFTKNIGACRAFHSSISTGAGNWTTAQLIEWLDSQGAFNHPYWMCKCSWSYGNNKIITDTGCGTIHLAGCVIEVMGNKGAMTIRVTTPSTSTGGGTTNAQFTYINHGADYAPGWRRDYSTKNQQPAFALGQTGSTVGNDKAVGWNSISGVYNANIGGASTLILHFYMGAGSCPAVQFRVNYKNGGIYYRSARDGYGFEADWSEFYTTTRKPSAGDVGAYTKAECNSRFITGIRLGTKSSVQTWNGPGWNDKSGYVVTASINSNKDELIDTTQARPVQYCINGTWYNAGSI